MINASSSAAVYEGVAVLGRVPALALATVRALYAAHDSYATLRDVLLADAEILAAIRLASPSLYASLVVWLAGGSPKNKRARLSALSYVLRMASRCTPFGLFASVGSVAVGERTTLGAGGVETRRLTTRPDAQWIYDLLAEQQRDPRWIWQAQVVANDLAIERGDALYVMDDAHASRVDTAARTPVWRYDPTHIRLNEAVTWLRVAATQPTRVDELVGRTAEHFRATTEIALRLVQRLLGAGVLEFVRPSLLDDPLDSLAVLLADHPKAGDITTLARATADFERDAARGVTPERIDALDAAFQEHRPCAGTAFGIDTVHDFTGTLGTGVLADVALLAKVMLADGPPLRLDALLRAFIDRYESLDRRIPLLELVHDDFVLDVQGVASEASAQRQTFLAGIAACALRDRVREIVLDDATFDHVFPNLRRAPLAQACEVGFMLAASSGAAIDAGDYFVLPTPGANSDGVAKSSSRFARLLGSTFGDRMRHLRAGRETGDAIVAELDYVPIETRSGNLIMRRPAYHHAIADASIQHTGGSERISPADILIGVENGRFTAYSRAHGRRIDIQETYVLETGYFAPPHMRFLAQIAQQDRRTPRPFDWGSAAAALPFLPRLRFGRVVLAVARWVIPRGELAGDIREIGNAIRTWRATWNVPRWVLLTERDVKLPLDLDSPVALELIRDALPKYRGDGIVFEEMLPAFEDAWLERDAKPVAHEFVATFAARESRATRALPFVAPRDTSVPPAPLGPASEWVYVKLYACKNELAALVRDVVPLVTTGCADAADRWFFLRYHDPEHHIRLRLHAVDGSGATLAGRVMHVLEPLLRSGRLLRYTFDTYRQEPERLGGLAALDSIERIFHADAQRVVAGVAAPQPAETRTTFALRTLVPFLRTWFETFDLDAWLNATAERVRGAGDIDYDLVRRVGGWLAQPYTSGEAEHEAIQTLATLERAGELERPSGYLLGAIVHLHFNRAGIDFAEEPRLEVHLWRALRALSAGRANRQKREVAQPTAV